MERVINDIGTSIALYAPKVLAALVLIIVAWLVATIVKAIVVRVLTAARIDERFGKHLSSTGQPTTLAKTVGDILFWLIILFFLPSILGALEFPGLLAPVQNMIGGALAFLPNIFAAVIIFVIGWLVARIVQRVVTGLLEAVGLDRLGERVGISQALGSQKLSGLVGLVIYFLILIPVLVAALNALQLDAITRPASAMLNSILLEIPNIFAAFLTLAIAYVVGRVVAGLISSLLAAFGFDSILARLGLGKLASAAAQATPASSTRPTPPTTPPSSERPQSGGVRGMAAEAGREARGMASEVVGGGPLAAARSSAPRSPSQVVGSLVLVAIMLFASIEALRTLGFTELATLVSQFTVLAGQIVLGLIIFALGLWLANLAATVIEQESTSANAELLALVARVAILVLAGAMALRQMGLANEIVTTAFTLLLGAIAVAVAVAFGLGGRDTAAELLEKWRGSVEAKSKTQQ